MAPRKITLTPELENLVRESKRVNFVPNEAISLGDSLILVPKGGVSSARYIKNTPANIKKFKNKNNRYDLNISNYGNLSFDLEEDIIPIAPPIPEPYFNIPYPPNRPNIFRFSRTRDSIGRLPYHRHVYNAYINDTLYRMTNDYNRNGLYTTHDIRLVQMYNAIVDKVNTILRRYPNTSVNRLNITLRFQWIPVEGEIPRYNQAGEFIFHADQFREIHYPDLYSYQTFVAVLERLLEDSENEDYYQVVAGELTGFELVYSWLSIGFYNEIQSRARDVKADLYFCYETIKQKGDVGCIYQSMLDIGYIMPDEFKNDECIFRLKEYINQNKLPIDIIDNIPDVFKYGDEVDITKEVIEIKPKIKPKIETKTKAIKRKQKAYQVIDINITPIYDYKTKNDANKKILILNKEFSHIAAAKDKWINITKMENKNKKEDEIKIEKVETPTIYHEDAFIMFDLETVVDVYQKSYAKPYAISYLTATESQLQELDDIEKNFNEDEKNKYIRKHCRNHVGFDCMNKFILYLENFYLNNPHTRIFLVGFNNSSFDNILLLDAMFEYRFNIETKPTALVYHGNKLSSFSCFNGALHFLDLRRHINNSLAGICKSFNIKHFAKKKDLISHKEIQNIFNNSKSNDEFIKALDNIGGGTDALTDYNNYDVLSLTIILNRHINTIVNIPCVIEGYKIDEIYNKSRTDKIKNKTKPIYEHSTMPSFMYKLSEAYNSKNNIKLMPLEYKDFKLIKTSMVGGRCDTFGKNKNEINERIVSMDKCSLYPYIMFIYNNAYFPCSNVFNGKMNKKHNNSKLGFYWVSVDQTNLKNKELPLPPIIPLKTPTGNDWASEACYIQDRVFLSTPKIESLLKYGCKVEYIIDEEYIEFEDKVSGYELFGWMLDFMNIKNNQDLLNRMNDPAYDSVLREMVKTMMNSLTGKYAENLHCTKTKAVSFNGYNNLLKDERIIQSSLTINNIIRNEVHVSYTQTEEACISGGHPIYIGSYIYDYAGEYMYNNLLSKLGNEKSLYMDTDAVKFRYSDLQLLTNLFDEPVPHWPEVEAIDPRYKDHKLYQENSKVFGSLENELKDNNYSIILAKKEWLCAFINDANEITYLKSKIKGVPDNTIVVDIEDEKFKKCIKIKRNKKDEITDIIVDQKLANKYDLNVDHTQLLKDPNTNLKVFKKLLAGESVYFMNLLFTKCIRNSNRKVNEEQTEKFNEYYNTIQIAYFIKSINRKNL